MNALFGTLLVLVGLGGLVYLVPKAIKREEIDFGNIGYMSGITRKSENPSVYWFLVVTSTLGSVLALLAGVSYFLK